MIIVTVWKHVYSWIVASVSYHNKHPTMYAAWATKKGHLHRLIEMHLIYAIIYLENSAIGVKQQSLTQKHVDKHVTRLEYIIPTPSQSTSLCFNSKRLCFYGE